MPRAYLGLGSNLGDTQAMLAAAMARLDATPGIRIVARSGFYRTPPWGDADQDWFLNAAAAVETDKTPHELLAAALMVEQSLGRVRERKWGPRTIDIDLLTYEDAAIHDATLILPHPRLMERAFALAPLVEIAPDLTVGGVRVQDALARSDRTGIERLPER
jgi:2-amino-4-hydroxy-6-hydroxymethyldihydropteridine diphosphokinase